MHYKAWSALGNKMNGFSVWPELARVMHKSEGFVFRVQIFKMNFIFCSSGSGQKIQKSIVPT